MNALIHFICWLGYWTVGWIGVIPYVEYAVDKLDHQKCWNSWSTGFRTYADAAKEANYYIDRDGGGTYRVSGEVRFHVCWEVRR